MEEDSWRKLLAVPAVVASAASGAEAQAPKLLEEQVVTEAKVSFEKRKITVSGLPEELLKGRTAALVAIENDNKGEKQVWYFQPKDSDGAWHFPVEKGVVTVTTESTDELRLFRPGHVWVLLLKDGQAETALRNRVKELPIHKDQKEGDTYLVQSAGRPDLATLLKDKEFMEATRLVAFRIVGDEKKPGIVRLVPPKAGMEEEDLDRELLYPSTSGQAEDLTFATVRRRYWTHPRREEMEAAVVPFLARHFGQTEDWVRERLAKGSQIVRGGNPFATATDVRVLVREVEAYRRKHLATDRPLDEGNLTVLAPSIVSTIDRHEATTGPFTDAVREILTGLDAGTTETELAEQIRSRYGAAAGPSLPPAGPSVPPSAAGMEEAQEVRLARSELMAADAALSEAEFRDAPLDIVIHLREQWVNAKGRLESLLRGRPAPTVPEALERFWKLFQFVRTKPQAFTPRPILVDASSDLRLRHLAQALSMIKARENPYELNFRLVIHERDAGQAVRELAAVDRRAAEQFLRTRIFTFDGERETAEDARRKALDSLAGDFGYASGRQLELESVLWEVKRLTPGLAMDLRAFFKAGGLHFVTHEAFDRLAALLEAA